ncbi:c-type cytochrome biogenesis protein CcmI [Thioalkalivibrio sp.]|uniref:c-type cytochrome biogenesis protein CcmI n=1 Tax=Thioalkalivibrio sp. TaxID=2093813 RepID=UPI0035652B79
MTAFIFLAAVLTAVALAFVFLPLVTGRQPGAPVPASGSGPTGLFIYRSQMAELDADRQNGVLSESQYNAARLDLQHSLLEMSNNEVARASAGNSWRWPALVTTLVLIPGLAALIYQGYGGGPQALDPPQQVAAQAPVTDASGDIEMVITTLRDRLEKSPDDPVGWALLGRAYAAIGQNRAAVQAYAQSLEHGGNQDADILVDYADLLGTVTGGSLEGRPRDLIQRALEIEPNHVVGLWLAGTADFRAGHYRGARDHWERLARLLPAESENAAVIRANLIEVESRLAARE